MSEELTGQDAISSIRSYYEKENAQLRSQLAEAREECARIADNYALGFQLAWQRIDSGQEIARRIRALSPTTPTQETKHET